MVKKEKQCISFKNHFLGLWLSRTVVSERNDSSNEWKVAAWFKSRPMQFVKKNMFIYLQETASNSTSSIISKALQWVTLLSSLSSTCFNWSRSVLSCKFLLMYWMESRGVNAKRCDSITTQQVDCCHQHPSYAAKSSKVEKTALLGLSAKRATLSKVSFVIRQPVA